MTAAGVRLPNGAVLKGGTLGLNLAINGPAKSLVISGPIALDNTRLVGYDIGSKVHGIAALSGLKTGDTTKIEKLRVNVRITNAGVLAEKIDAADSRGRRDHRQRNGFVRESIGLQPRRKNRDRGRHCQGRGTVAHEAKRFRHGLQKTTGVPLHVIGTPEDPNITADVGGIIQKKKKSIAALFEKKK